MSNHHHLVDRILSNHLPIYLLLEHVRLKKHGDFSNIVSFLILYRLQNEHDIVILLFRISSLTSPPYTSAELTFSAAIRAHSRSGDFLVGDLAVLRFHGNIPFISLDNPNNNPKNKD